ncbi:hypothetical protein QBC46DRAFT_416566 [Diplogelasinospora grovesii]|uniref:Uncharacterized protein n=1 Tax=Diplogelasinospora grovesii TaxID=303347 RepID=A0AAN6S1N9_9PEZI|nr:hypothetical protein QBC46DRAFT_416566 [Diplogelasinospora grovesii]
MFRPTLGILCKHSRSYFLTELVQSLQQAATLITRCYCPLPPIRPVPRKNGSIAEDQNDRDMEDWEPLFHVIKGHFQGLGVSITEVMYYRAGPTGILLRMLP